MIWIAIGAVAFLIWGEIQARKKEKEYTARMRADYSYARSMLTGLSVGLPPKRSVLGTIQDLVFGALFIGVPLWWVFG